MDFRSRRQGDEARKRTLGAPVNGDEMHEVMDAFAASGYVNTEKQPVMADGVRAIAFAFARDARVRDAVARYWRELASGPQTWRGEERRTAAAAAS